MSSSSLLLRFLRRNCKPPSAAVLLLPRTLPELTPVRAMGGGPRTFKGGLSKWQYKRMHEKLAKEKERKLLNQEKQLYQARLRSEIRAMAAGKPPSQPSNLSGPMTSKDHIKALADRFMKAGAEDLWNEDDGPLRSPRLDRDRDRSPPDTRRIIGRPGLIAGQQQQRREYSKSRRNESSDEDEDYGPDSGVQDNKFGNALKLLKFNEEEGEGEEEPAFGSGRKRRKEMRSGAALGDFDVKRERRRFPKEDDLAEQIREVREEVRSREKEPWARRERRDEIRGSDGSVLTQKR